MTLGIPALRLPRGGAPSIVPMILIGLAAATWSLIAIGGPMIVRLIMVGLVGAVVTVAVIKRWPIQSMAWVPVLLVPPQVAKIFAYEIAILLIAAGIWLWAWTQREPWIGKLNRLEVWVWMFVGWGIFTVLWADDKWWWLFNVRLLVIGAITLWVSWRLTRFVPADLMLAGVAAGTCALALASLGRAYAVGWFGSVHQTHMRRTATSLGWGDSNYIATILAVMLPTCMYLAMNGKGVPRVLGLIAPPLTVLLIAVAASRGGALMIVGIILFMLFRTRVKGWVRYLSAAVMLALMSVGPGAELLLGRFTDVRDMLSIVVRFMYFREAWHRTLDHWPVGMGLGDALNHHDRLNGEDAHNYWLMLASELGLVGLVLWIGVLIVLYRRILRMLQNPETRLIGQAIQLTFWIAMVNCLFEPTFNGLQYQFAWYWIVGLYLGWMEQLSGRYPPPMTGSRTHEPLAAGSRAPT